MARELDESLYAGKQMTALDAMAQAMIIDAGAPAHAEPEWLQANWKQIGKDVKRLQVRIAKATLEGRWGKVKALQHLLTRSHSGKMLAVKRVTENRGKRTPGVDGKIWSSPAAKWNGMQSLRHRGYRARPLRRVYIPKSNGKKRPLGIPCMCCRALQALWKLALEPVAESPGGSELLRISARTLDRRCHRTVPASRKGTRWDLVLFVLAAYRLLEPGSEWRLHREWYGRTALADLLGADDGLADPHLLYGCHRRLLERKRAAELSITHNFLSIFSKLQIILASHSGR
jgi:N-terminal domain of reverse transcriptase